MPKFMIIYGFADCAKMIPLPDKAITAIEVTVLSGDETGEVLFEDGTTLNFDARDCRIISSFDGRYTIRGAAIDKWTHWNPTGKKMVSYSRMVEFCNTEKN